MRRRRLPTSSTDPRRPRGDLRTTNRQVSTDAPAIWWRRQYRDIKKLIFLAPTTCPSDLIGSLANRTTLKQLHARFSHSLKKRVFPGFEELSTGVDASPRHRSGTPKVNNGPLTQKIYQKETGARTSVGGAGGAAVSRLLRGGSIISQRERRFGSSIPEPSMRPVASWFTVDATLRALSTTAARAGPATRTRSST